MAAKKLTIYSDFICPFCYIGKVNAERVQEMVPDLEIEWKEFELHPEGQPDPGSPYMKQAQDSVNHLAEKYGIDMKPDVLTTVTSDSRIAMMGLHYAEEKGKSAEYRNAVFHAYWIEGHDIGNLDVLGGVVSSLGMDESEFLEALRQEKYLPAVLEEIEHAHKIGVQGVPTYEYEGEMTMGAQSPERLKRFVEAVDDLKQAKNSDDAAPACGPEGC
ncbi:DsbA family oxidoreductase [Metabacillus sp. 84]|uniref:DsbA family oxidoreductase n=1 Tax=unclassified Metabacillus TaxID=2675274 RepID=UPI003CF83D63